MPFNAKFLDNASKEYEVTAIKNDFEIASVYIRKAVEKVAKQNLNVRAKNVEIYIHGSYANKTNIWFPSSLEICVELKRTPLWEPSVQSVAVPDKKGALPENFTPQYNIHNNYYVTHNLDFSPKVFRELLFNAMSETTGEKCSENDKTIIIPRFGNLKHIIEVTPCFSFDYHDDEDRIFKGVLLYNADVRADIITFPRLHAQNGQAKDIACNGNFKKCVRLFKTLNAIAAREFEIMPERGYFIECLLFNVPELMYKAPDTSQVFFKVLNYLLNCDIEEFVCQNTVWHLFGSASEFWTQSEAHNFIKLIGEFYKGFPESRTLLA